MDTYAFALVLLAAVSVVGASTTFAVRARLMRLESRFTKLVLNCNARFGTLESKLSASTSASLSARIDDLAAAAETQRATIRRELGKLWGKISGGGHSETEHAPLSNGGDFEAMLRLQSTPASGGPEK
jgi:hypothetical protein